VNIILQYIGIDTERFTYKWVSAAEGIRFVQVITEFDGKISDLGPFGEKEGLDSLAVRHKLRAALKTVEGRTFRMAFARQAKQMKDEGTFGQFPSKEKLLEMFQKEMNLYQTMLYLEEKERSAEELTDLLGIPEDQVMAFVEKLKKNNMWNGELL
jgi:DNA-binding IscR family transcriptional regulator